MTFRRLIAVSLIAWIAAAGTARARDPIRLDDHLSADTVLYAEIPSFAVWEKVGEEGLLARLKKRPGLREVLKPLFEQLEAGRDQTFARAFEQANLGAEDFRRLIDGGGVAIAVEDILGEPPFLAP